MSSPSNSDDQDSVAVHMYNGISKEITLKVLIVGDYGVGKTAIVKQYVEGQFSSNYKITIGADFSIKTVAWDSSTQLNIQLWDIAGHESFGSMTRIYYKYAAAAAVVFDTSRVATFHSVQKWLNDLRDKVSLPDGSPVPVIIMANKCDISICSPSCDALDKLCKEWNVKKWYLTSAKENHNIDEAMMYLISCAMENREKEVVQTSDKITLGSEDTDDVTHRNCCP